MTHHIIYYEWAKSSLTLVDMTRLYWYIEKYNMKAFSQNCVQNRDRMRLKQLWWLEYVSDRKRHSLGHCIKQHSYFPLHSVKRVCSLFIYTAFLQYLSLSLQNKTEEISAMIFINCTYNTSLQTQAKEVSYRTILYYFIYENVKNSVR